ncbi:focadhesin isoform X2 [Patella vulgata]|nr:focadhesin isoform X2 [Patella vulgata]XP_050400638.1 focadhesin isoform X2 [Patella vulgata]
MDILPGLQTKSTEDLGRCLQFLTQLLHVMSSRPSFKTDNVVGPLLPFCISLLHPCLKKNLNITSLLQEILNLLEKHKSIPFKENCLIILADLLMLIGPDITANVLLICKTIIEKDICYIVRGMLVLPVLQLLSSPTEQSNSNHIQNLASNVLTLIVELPVQNIPEGHEVPCQYLNGDSRVYNMYVNLAHDFTKDVKAAVDWLQNVKDYLTNLKSVPLTLSNMVCALIVTSSDQTCIQLSLTLLVEIAKKDNTQSANFLPLLLYQIGKEKDAEMRLIILDHIPAMARHKVCIGPILKTILMIGNSTKLRAVAIRLLTQLWQLQDRCFPHLMKLLTDKSNTCLHSDDVIIAQASAIRHVCQLRPEVHGEDLLSPVSDILNKCSDIHMAPAAALALEALYMMCEAEVIDIKSAWSLLAVKLSTDTRPAIIEKMCDLFGLVPSLYVNTPEYDQFMKNILEKLWVYCQDTNPIIVGSSYQALASYSLDNFYLDHLPYNVTKEIRKDIEKKAKDHEQDTEPYFHIPVPSVCYLNILKSLNPDILEDFGVFLSGIIGREVDDLPRGIYHSSTRRQTVVSNQGKAISSIPAFILTQYEKTRQPGLRPSLAAGLLFCYDPSIEVGRDGRPRRHYVISHGKNYQQMFETLLHEVTIQPSEWHRCMLLPQAWTSFVDRLYSAVIESRKVEIELQVRQGNMEEEEANEKISTNWLWVRDILTDIIKKTSRESPSVQGNSILALSGLAVAVSRVVSGLQDDDLEKAKKVSQHMSHSCWLMIVLDTIMCLMDVEYKSKGDILGMCQQRDVKEKKPASLLARTSACMALTQLIPVMMTCDTDRIYDLITRFINSLPGRPSVDKDSPVAQFYHGLASGMLLSRLFEEHFSDICGTKGMTEVWKALSLLEDCCLDSELENRNGALLGLGLCISGLCQDGKTDSRVHVINIQEKLMTLCKSTDTDDKSYQAICVALACISGSAYDTNIIPTDQINLTVELLYCKNQEYKQVTGVSLALGMLCYSLDKIGHPSIGKLRQELSSTWSKALTSEETCPMEKVAILNGLLAIIGSERTLIPIQTSTGLSGIDSSTNDILKLTSQIVTSSKDIGLQTNAAWMLGHLYLSACAVAETRASVSPNYKYLKETSLLRAVVDFLLEAGKYGPETVTNQQLKIALSSLQDEVSRLLPPLNWVGVLSPIMRLEYEAKIKYLCLKLAISQCISAPTASTFLSSWMTPPLFESLPDECKVLLYTSLPLMIKSLAVSVVKTFVEKCCMLPFNTSGNIPFGVAVLDGMNKALLVQDPPKSVTSILYDATCRFYKNLPEIIHVPLLSNMAKCFLSIPDDLFDTWTQDDLYNQKTFVKGVFIRCQLVAFGRQPIAILNSCLDATINNKECDRTVIFNIVSHCFYSVNLCKSELTGPMNQLQWLLELLGHIRNLAIGVIKLENTAPPLKQAVEFIIGIASAAISLWTSCTTSYMIGIKANLLLYDDNLTIDNDVDIDVISLSRCLQCLPIVISHLKTEPWLQILPKVIDWMMTMIQLPEETLSTQVKQTLKDSLYSLRDSEEFKKASVWTNVFTV